MGGSLSPELTLTGSQIKAGSNLDMPIRSIWTISPMALILAAALPPVLCAQTAAPKSVDGIKIDTWNSTPLTATDYKGVKSDPAPRRDLSGIWDATGEGDARPPRGIQISGADEHRAVRAWT